MEGGEVGSAIASPAISNQCRKWPTGVPGEFVGKSVESLGDGSLPSTGSTVFLINYPIIQKLMVHLDNFSTLSVR